MEITFASAKDTVNIANHGVSLTLAADLEWDWLLFERDARRDHGEVRMIGYAPLGKRGLLRGFHGSRLNAPRRGA